jgi:hypothetical protein
VASEQVAAMLVSSRRSSSSGPAGKASRWESLGKRMTEFMAIDRLAGFRAFDGKR